MCAAQDHRSRAGVNSLNADGGLLPTQGNAYLRGTAHDLDLVAALIAQDEDRFGLKRVGRGLLTGCPPQVQPLHPRRPVWTCCCSSRAPFGPDWRHDAPSAARP
eukprot:scaffold321996_cov33-Tisochrysis_lutea.AAC.2